MSVVGYCGYCDRQFEFHSETVKKSLDRDGYSYINISCPICGGCEEVPTSK